MKAITPALLSQVILFETETRLTKMTTLNSYYTSKIERIKTLADIYDKQQDTQSLVDFQQTVSDYINRTFERPDHELREITALHIPALFKAVMKREAEISYKLSNDVLRFLAVPKSLEYMMTAEHADEALAWYCCDRSTLYVIDENERTMPAFRRLLARWRGLSEEDIPLPTLDKVVELLYGPTCWTLYGCQLDSDTPASDMVSIRNAITSAGLPLIKTEMKPAPNNTPSLPDSII